MAERSSVICVRFAIASNVGGAGRRLCGSLSFSDVVRRTSIFCSGADHEQFRAWLSAAWFEIVASGDLRHLRAGTQAQVADTDCGRYFAYGVKSSGSKEYQNQVPENFENVGRFWGNWNIAPEWKGAEISSSDFVELRRRMCAWSKSKGGFVPSRSRVQGGWLLTEGLSAAMVLSQLARGLPSVERLVV
jgi:hypothetical protein